MLNEIEQQDTIFVINQVVEINSTEKISSISYLEAVKPTQNTVLDGRANLTRHG